jgi:hypothetical protein
LYLLDIPQQQTRELSDESTIWDIRFDCE